MQLIPLRTSIRVFFQKKYNEKQISNLATILKIQAETLPRKIPCDLQILLNLTYLFLCVPGMARIQSEIDRSQVVTAKCSEPQVVDSDVRDGGSGVAILSSVRTETGYKAKWWIRLLNKPKSKR